jgi:predicted nucleic acid-binding protein
VQALADPAAGNDLYVARITTVEVVSAVTRRQRGGHISSGHAVAILAQFRLDLLAYGIVEITPALLSHAMTLAETHGLRAYDAVQLAATLELQARRADGGLSPITLVSSDRDLNAAATVSGVLVEDQTLHP